MIKAKYLEKYKDNNGKIIAYLLEDTDGNRIKLNADYVKHQILKGTLDVINLTLTSDNRLIDKKVVNTAINDRTTKDKEMILKIMQKAKLLNKLKEIQAYSGDKVYLVSQSDTMHFVYIPDNVTILNDKDNNSRDTFTHKIKRLRGTIKVIGGSGLVSTCDMFKDCAASKIDISSLDTSNVTDMSSMFNKCSALDIDLTGIDTHLVTDMSFMFAGCWLKSIDLSHLDTSEVTDMRGMFHKCKIENLGKLQINTRNVVNMNKIFEGLETKSLDISGLDTSSVQGMRAMFKSCNIQSLNIGGIDTRRVLTMQEMFKHSRIPVIALTNFDTLSVDSMIDMFYNCNSSKIDITSFKTGDRPNKPNCMLSGMFELCRAEVLVNDEYIKRQLDIEVFKNQKAINIGIHNNDIHSN